MGTNPKIDKIHEAWFEFEHCLHSERAAAEGRLNQLLDSIVAESQGQCTRDQILDHLFSSYKVYKSQRCSNEKVQIVQMQVKS